MIDTDKYEGLTKQDLIEILKDADPFALLAEVKRLRGIIDYIRDTGKMDRTPSGHLLSIMEKVLTTEEYLEWRNEE